MPIPSTAAPGGMPPAQMQELLMMMVKSNPELLANLMASKGVQPPTAPAGMKPGEDMMAHTEATQGLGALVQPQVEAAPTAAPPMVMPFAGVSGPTILPQDQPLSPPGSPGLPGGGGGGFKPGVAELMQMLMAAQGQNNAAPPSLGQAIVQR